MFIIIEIQKANEGSAAVCPVLVFVDRDQAEASYHTKLAAAAVSSVNVHTVTMLTDTGELVKKETFYHGA